MIRDSVRVHLASGLIAADQALPPGTRSELVAVDPLVAQLWHFSKFSTFNTQVFSISVFDQDQLLGLLPAVRLHRRPIRKLLRPSTARWIAAALGPLGRKTNVLVDTAFLAYDDASPIRMVAATDRIQVARCAVQFLCRQVGVDSVTIVEPEGNAVFAHDPDFDSFEMTPMAIVETANLQSFGEYLAKISKKQRRNFRAAATAFEQANARIDHYSSLPSELICPVYECLRRSADRSALYMPYQDVMTSPEAFRHQPQEFLVASIDAEVIGFASFVQVADRLLQTHGGLDYQHSYRSQAYHNLMHQLICVAIDRRCVRLNLGPLNNETKRRISSGTGRLVASVWNRKRLDRYCAQRFFIPKLQVNTGNG